MDETVDLENMARLVAFCGTCCGILILAVLLGFIVDGKHGYPGKNRSLNGPCLPAIHAMMSKLYQGMNPIAERGHSLMLGWSMYSIDTILELCEANASEGGGMVVVLTSMNTEVRSAW